jgi:hypothetical protein
VTAIPWPIAIPPDIAQRRAILAGEKIKIKTANASRVLGLMAETVRDAASVFCIFTKPDDCVG